MDALVCGDIVMLFNEMHDMTNASPSVRHLRCMKQREIQLNQAHSPSPRLDALEDGLIIGVGELGRVWDVWETHLGL
jgi:hypothetical protein